MMMVLTGSLVACSMQPTEVGPKSDPSGHAKVQTKEKQSNDRPAASEDRASEALDEPEQVPTRQPQLERPKAEPANSGPVKEKSPKAEKVIRRSEAPQPKKTKQPAKPAKASAPKSKPSAEVKRHPKKQSQKPAPPVAKKPSVAPKPPKSKPTPPESKPKPEPAPPKPPAAPQVGDIVQVGDGAIWWPSFQLSPIDDGSRSEGSILFDDMSWAQDELRLYTNFNAAPVPSHNCGVLDVDYPVDDDHDAFRAEMQPIAENYANCLYDSWRPLLEQAGAEPFEHVNVSTCPGPGCEVMEPHFAAAAMGDQILLGEHVYGWSGWYMTRVIAHETAHVIQNSVRTPESMVSVVNAGYQWTMDENEGPRRHEFQAECLSSTMIDKAVPLPFQEHVVRFGSMSPDEIHGDPQSIDFWVAQGLKGRVGECNAYLADPSLTTYDPEWVWEDSADAL